MAPPVSPHALAARAADRPLACREIAAEKLGIWHADLKSIQQSCRLTGPNCPAPTSPHHAAVSEHREHGPQPRARHPLDPWRRQRQTLGYQPADGDLGHAEWLASIAQHTKRQPRYLIADEDGVGLQFRRPTVLLFRLT